MACACAARPEGLVANEVACHCCGRSLAENHPDIEACSVCDHMHCIRCVYDHAGEGVCARCWALPPVAALAGAPLEGLHFQMCGRSRETNKK